MWWTGFYIQFSIAFGLPSCIPLFLDDGMYGDEDTRPLYNLAANRRYHSCACATIVTEAGQGIQVISGFSFQCYVLYSLKTFPHLGKFANSVHPALLSAFTPSTKENQKHHGTLLYLFTFTWISSEAWLKKLWWGRFLRGVPSSSASFFGFQSALDKQGRKPSEMMNLKWIRSFTNVKENNDGDLAMLDSVRQIIRWIVHFIIPTISNAMTITHDFISL